MSPKDNKKSNKWASAASFHYFKINAPLLWCPLFFKEYLNFQVKINQMVVEHRVDHHPSGLISRLHPHICIDPLGLYLSPEYLLDFLSNKFETHTMVGENFQNYYVQIIGDCVQESETESLHFYSSKQVFPQVLIIILQTDGNYSLLSQAAFFPKSIPPGSR